jgi:hypothetical protein
MKRAAGRKAPEAVAKVMGDLRMIFLYDPALTPSQVLPAGSLMVRHHFSLIATFELLTAYE